MRVLLFLMCFIFSLSVFGKDFDISEIKFTGLHSYSEDYLLERLRLRNRDLDSDFFINATRFRNFDSVKVFIIDDNILNIDIIEKPVFREVTICGDIDLHFYYLVRKYRIKSGEIYDRAYVDFFKRDVKVYYLGHGFRSLDLQVDVKIDKILNRVDINISMIKNAPLYIEKVYFTGNKVFSAKELLPLLKQFTQRSHRKFQFFRKGRAYFTPRLTNDIKNLRSYYIYRGYVNFSIKFIRLCLAKDKKTLYMVFNVAEGNKYTFGNVRVVSYKCEPDLIKEFKKVIHSHIVHGDVYSPIKVSKAKKYLRKFLKSYGKNNIKIISKFTIKYNSVNILFRLRLCKKVFIKKISFFGNIRTNEYVLRNFFFQQEYSRFYVKKAVLFKETLLKNFIATTAGLAFEKAKRKKRVRLVYKIIETKTSKFSLGCSSTPTDIFVINLNSELPNILGSGRDLVFNFVKGQRQVDCGFTYVVPCFFYRKFELVSTFSYKKELLKKQLSDFNHFVSTFGGAFYIQFRFWTYGKINFGIGHDAVTLILPELRVPREFLRFINLLGRRYNEYNVISNLIYNSLNKLQSPTSGSLHRLIVKVSLFFSDLRYYYLNYDLNMYIPLPKHCTFGFYFNFSYGNKYVNMMRYPFFRTFFLRGINNIRGFKDKSLGPRNSKNYLAGGNLLISSKFILYFPIPAFFRKYRMRPSLFFDMGRLYKTPIIHPSHRGRRGLPLKVPKTFLKCSYGVGFIWHTPFGIPIEIAFGFPLNPESNDVKQVVTFNIGTFQI